MTWLISALLVALALLVIEDRARRSNRARVRYLEGWIHRHFKGSGAGDYELARADDHRADVRHWTPPVGGIEHPRGMR